MYIDKILLNIYPLSAYRAANCKLVYLGRFRTPTPLASTGTGIMMGLPPPFPPPYPPPLPPHRADAFCPESVFDPLSPSTVGGIKSSASLLTRTLPHFGLDFGIGELFGVGQTLTSGNESVLGTGSGVGGQEHPAALGKDG